MGKIFPNVAWRADGEMFPEARSSRGRVTGSGSVFVNGVAYDTPDTWCING